MTTLTFDTHESVKELKDAGFTEQQAEAITKLQKTAINSTLEQARHDYNLDDLATKRDLKNLELELKRDIEILKSDTRAQIAESKADLIRWVVGVGLLQITVITALLLKLTGTH